MPDGGQPECRDSPPRRGCDGFARTAVHDDVQGSRMERRKYLIIGGGLAADAAIRGIRELDRDGSILALSDGDAPPYNRPPLSKALWRGAPVGTIWRHTTLSGARSGLGPKI